MKHRFIHMRLVLGVLALMLCVAGCAGPEAAEPTFDPLGVLNTAAPATDSPNASSEDPADQYLQLDTQPAPETPASDIKNKYNIDVDIDISNMMANCTQTLDYVNATDSSMAEVYFHLYPSAFRDTETAPFPAYEIEHNIAYPGGFDVGTYIHSGVQVNGEDVDGELLQNDQILKVPLKTPLEPGQRIQFNFVFSVKLPLSPGRFGYAANTINMCNFYPVACVRDAQGWHLDNYYKFGEPFYSDVSDYTVKVVAVPQVEVMGSGIVEKSEGGARTTWTFTAENMRDFAIVASNPGPDLQQSMLHSSQTVDGVEIISYYFKGDSEEFGKKALQFAADALAIYNRRFGQYPYQTLTILQADYYMVSASYPGIILMDSILYKKLHQDQILEPQIAAMVGAQWWGGVVGADQANDAWMGAGLAEYCSMVYQKEKYGEKVRDIMYANRIVSNKYLPLWSDSAWSVEKEILTRRVDQFASLDEYESLVLGKAPIMFKHLQDQLGDAAFYRFLSEYYQKFGYKNPKQADMITVAKEATGQDLTEFFNNWLNGITIPPEAQ